MKKTLRLQPKDFGQAFRLWLRRPDYGLEALWLRRPLTLHPHEDLLHHSLGAAPAWRIEEIVNGALTTVYAEEGQINPQGFRVLERPRPSWWEAEGRAAFGAYARHFVPHGPSLQLLVVFFLGLIWVISRGEASLAYLVAGDLKRLARNIAGILVATAAFTLWFNYRFRGRNHLAGLLFRAEAWLLLLGALTSTPGLEAYLESLRVQVKQAMELENSTTTPTSSEASPAAAPTPGSL